MAKYLVTADAYVNAAHKNGFTPRHIDALVGQNWNLEVATYPVIADADVNAADKNGATPLTKQMLYERDILRCRSIS